MKFILSKECFSRSRLGLLCFEAISNERKDYLTPLCLQYTINGSVPHIVSELLEELNDDNSPLLIPLPTTLLMNESLRAFNVSSNGHKSGIVGFAGIHNWRPSIVSIQDPLLAIKGGHNRAEEMSVFCRGGKQAVSSDKLIDVITNFRPDAYQGLCDSDTPFDASNKRISKSVERSVYLLQECIEKHNESEELKSRSVSIFGTIEGGFSQKARIKSAKETADKEVDGFVIDGFHTYGAQVLEKFDFLSVEPILTEIIEILPKDKPKAMFGTLSPKLILKLIANGIDVFDSSYATVMTEKGFALQQILDSKNLRLINKTIDLNDKQFKEDFGPIDEQCLCYSCSKGFSRAYVNHLLNASEMLAKVLLSFHNLHTFYEFFRQIRDVLNEQKFELLLKKL